MKALKDMDSFNAEYLPLDTNVWPVNSCKNRVSVAVEGCQLCGYSKRPFFCQKCVKDGRFSRSSRMKTLLPPIDNADYKEAKMEWLKLKARNMLLKNEIEIMLKEREEERTKKLRILLSKQKSKLLQTVLACLQNQVKKDKINLEKLKSDKEKTQKDIFLIQAKLSKIQKYMESLPIKLEKSVKEFKIKKESLVNIRKLYIKQLVECLFPITTYKPTSESTDSLGASCNTMISMLKDARFTAYIGGRWVYADSGWDQMYKIIEASLPGNGDYVAYMHSGGANDPLLRSHEDSNTAALWSVCAALSLITQMVHVCAYILDYKLPYNLSFRVFCDENLTDRQFKKYVNRLNKNILYLCLYENVDRFKLQGLHTIINVLHLIRSPLLGCDTPSSDFVTPESTSTTESINDATDKKSTNLNDSIFACFNESEDEDDDDENETDDSKIISGTHIKSKTIEKDWEYIPAALPEVDTMCQQQKSGSYFSSSIQQTSSVGNFVSSFWKAAWGGGSSDK